MNTFNGSFSQGSIILFVGDPPSQLSQLDIVLPGDQPSDQIAQGYPQLRGFIVTAAKFNPDMGVSVDELTQ